MVWHSWALALAWASAWALAWASALWARAFNAGCATLATAFRAWGGGAQIGGARLAHRTLHSSSRTPKRGPEKMPCARRESASKSSRWPGRTAVPRAE
eukprot:XP_001700630.1 predicted protein [Chlamydomonas reinhardtii]